MGPVAFLKVVTNNCVLMIVYFPVVVNLVEEKYQLISNLLLGFQCNRDAETQTIGWEFPSRMGKRLERSSGLEEKHGGKGMLRFLLGRSGSGKTHLVDRMLKKMAESGHKRLLLLIPEQCSFERERSLLQLLGDQLFQTVEIMSFSRLPDLVFRQLGGLAGRRLDDGGRAILMSIALEQVQDQLSVYQKQAGSVEMVNLMLEAEKECKTCGILPTEMQQVALQLEEGSLAKKLEETALILEAYQALVGQSYLDPLEDLTRLSQRLQEVRFFDGYTIFVDAFSGFTGQEKTILEQMMIQADDLYVSLCMDDTDDRKTLSLFTPVQKTAAQLKRIAQMHQIPVAVPTRLKEGKRFSGEGLRVWERNLYRNEKERYEHPITDLHLYHAASPYDESEQVARTIRRLVMEQGMRYRDIEIICRDAESYRGILDNMLEKYEIPYFMDKPERIDAKPLMNLVLTAFDIVHTGWSTTEVFRYLKTGLAGLETEEISILENYALLWSISGEKWREPFASHPDGFSSSFSEKDREELSQINALRERVVLPLLHFAGKISDSDGEEISRAIYGLLEELHTASSLKELAAALMEDGNLPLAEEQERLWDLLMQVLDQIALVLGNHAISSRRYVELLRLIINSSELAFIPQGLDEVMVGLADRARPAQPKITFVMGAQEGNSPEPRCPPVCSAMRNAGCCFLWACHCTIVWRIWRWRSGIWPIWLRSAHPNVSIFRGTGPTAPGLPRRLLPWFERPKHCLPAFRSRTNIQRIPGIWPGRRSHRSN